MHLKSFKVLVSEEQAENSLDHVDFIRHGVANTVNDHLDLMKTEEREELIKGEPFKASLNEATDLFTGGAQPENPSSAKSLSIRGIPQNVLAISGKFDKPSQISLPALFNNLTKWSNVGVYATRWDQEPVNVKGLARRCKAILLDMQVCFYTKL